MSIKVTGADELYQLRQRLKAAPRDHWKACAKALRVAVRPAPMAAKNSARNRLPQRGGLGQRVAQRTKFRTRVTTGAKSVGVSLVATSDHNIKRMNEGKIRHNLFGNRRYWYPQDVNPGWFSDPMHDLKWPVRIALLRVMADTVRRVEGQGHG